MHFSRHLYSVAAILAVLTVASYGAGHTRGGAPTTSSVVVTNTSSNPVPATITSLPAVQIGANNTVTVGNQPTVNIGANQSVGISGEPTVHVDPSDTVHVAGDVTSTIAPNQSIGISGEPTVHVDPNDTITVGNDATHAVPTHDVDVANRTPISKAGLLMFANTATSASDVLYQVPAGKRLIIQTVYQRGSTALGSTFLSTQIAGFPIPINDHGVQVLQSLSLDVEDGLTNVYAPFPAGSFISITAYRTAGNGQGDVDFGFTGYLEDGA